MGHFVDADGFKKYQEKQAKLVALMNELLELTDKGETDTDNYKSIAEQITQLKQEIKEYEEQNINK